MREMGSRRSAATFHQVLDAGQSALHPTATAQQRSRVDLMTIEHANRLQLDVEQLSRTVGFFESYANTALDDLEAIRRGIDLLDSSERWDSDRGAEREWL